MLFPSIKERLCLAGCHMFNIIREYTFSLG